MAAAAGEKRTSSAAAGGTGMVVEASLSETIVEHGRTAIVLFFVSF